MIFFNGYTFKALFLFTVVNPVETGFPSTDPFVNMDLSEESFLKLFIYFSVLPFNWQCSC